MSWQKNEAVEVGRVCEIEELSTGEWEILLHIKNNYLGSKKTWATTKTSYPIGEFVRIKNHQILGEFFATSISCTEIPYFMHHLFSFKEEELKNYHRLLKERYMTQIDSINYADVFMQEIISYNYKKDIEVLVQNRDFVLKRFLTSRYIAHSFIERLTGAAQEMNEPTLDFLIYKREIKEFTEQEVACVMNFLKEYNKKEKKQDETLFHAFSFLLFHQTGEGVKEYLNHSNPVEVASHFLATSGIYYHDEICKEIQAFHLFFLFQHFLAISKEKAKNFCFFVRSLTAVDAKTFLLYFWQFVNNGFLVVKKRTIETKECIEVKQNFMQLVYENYGIVFSFEEEGMPRKKSRLKSKK